MEGMWPLWLVIANLGSVHAQHGRCTSKLLILPTETLVVEKWWYPFQLQHLGSTHLAELGCSVNGAGRNEVNKPTSRLGRCQSPRKTIHRASWRQRRNTHVHVATSASLIINPISSLSKLSSRLIVRRLSRISCLCVDVRLLAVSTFRWKLLRQEAGRKMLLLWGANEMREKSELLRLR